MACHTWEYKKLSSCPKEEQAKFIEEINKDIQSDIYNCPFEEYFKETKELADLYIKYAEEAENKKEADEWRYYAEETHCKERWEKQNKKLEPFKSGVNVDNLIDYCKKYRSVSYKVINNIIYINNGCDTPFRLHGYPDETFTDMNALMEWLKKNQKETNRLVYYKDDETIQVTSDNWSEFEKYMNDFFNVEGIDNFYFEFG